MRRIKDLLMLGLMPVMCLALAVGCNPEPDPTPEVEKDSVIKVKNSTVTAGIGGGSCFIEYEIQNPHSGEQITATADADWVSNFDCSLSGAIKCTIEPNDEANGRECTVTLKYRYAEDVTVTIRQGARLNASFSLENVDTSDYYSYTIDVIPSDNTKPFIMMSADVEYVANFENGGTDEELYNDDMDYFGYLGSFYGQSAIDVLNVRARLGAQRNITLGNATPGMTYIFYAYYVDLTSGARISDITRFEIVVGHPELSNVSFDFDYEIAGPAAWTEALAQGEVGDYYFDVMSAAELNWAEVTYGYTKEQYIQRWWAGTVVAMMNDMRIDEILGSCTCAGTNADGSPRSEYVYELAANTEYYLFAFTLDTNSALATSVPVYTTFTTGMPEQSSNVITIDITDITSYTARFNYTTTNNDHYVAGWETADLWATYGNNDAERVEYLLSHFGYEYIHGNFSYNETGLDPDTDYVAYAFGMQGGVQTTALFTANFRTRGANAGSVSIAVKDLGYYDPADIATYPGYEFFGSEYYQSWAIMPIEFEFSSPDHGMYAFDVHDWEGRNDEYPDEQYINHLIWMFDNGQNCTATHTYFMIPWEHRCVLSAMVIDNDGNYSDLYKRELYFTYDGAGDAADYVAWWDNYQNGGAGLQSCVIENERPFRVKQAGASRVAASQMTFEKSVVVAEVDSVVASH